MPRSGVMAEARDTTARATPSQWAARARLPSPSAAWTQRMRSCSCRACNAIVPADAQAPSKRAIQGAPGRSQHAHAVRASTSARSEGSTSRHQGRRGSGASKKSLASPRTSRQRTSAAKAPCKIQPTEGSPIRCRAGAESRTSFRGIRRAPPVRSVRSLARSSYAGPSLRSRCSSDSGCRRRSASAPAPR